MNKENLNNKIWYRTLKVLFFASFIFVQLLSFFITFSVTSSTREFVKCINGKEFENPYYGLEFYNFSNEADLTRRCENSNINNSSNFNPLDYEAKPVDFVPDKLPYSKYEKAQYSLVGRGAFLFGSIIIVSFIFWLLAKIFFYVILGEKIFSLNRKIKS